MAPQLPLQVTKIATLISSVWCSAVWFASVSYSICSGLKRLIFHGSNTTGNAAFAVRSNPSRASFIGRTTKSFFVVGHPKRTTTNLSVRLLTPKIGTERN
jgi:hypothetical protein